MVNIEELCLKYVKKDTKKKEHGKITFIKKIENDCMHKIYRSIIYQKGNPILK